MVVLNKGPFPSLVLLAAALTTAVAVEPVFLNHGSPARILRDNTMECFWQHSQGMDFDLRPLKAVGPFTVYNEFWHDNRHWNYTYPFAICKNVPGRRVTTQPAGVCKSTKGDDGKDVTTAAPAYQVFNSDWGGDLCHRLANDVSIYRPSWGIVDAYRKAEGVTLSYHGGDVCKNNMGQKRPCKLGKDGKTRWCDRQLVVNIMCDPESWSVPTRQQVQEFEGCRYELTINSVFGCPTQCWDDPTSVCNKHGQCGYDEDESRAKCYCETGWSGDRCTEPAYGDMVMAHASMLAAALVIVGCFGFMVRNSPDGVSGIGRRVTEGVSFGGFSSGFTSSRPRYDSVPASASTPLGMGA